jgi:hypothetical protein
MATRHGRRRFLTRLRYDPLEPRETPADIAVIDFGSGFTTPGMSGNFDDGQLLLTNGPYQSVAFWDRMRVDARAFHSSFVFQQGDPNPASNEQRGDGFTFALSSRFTFGGGVAGGGLGYQGLTDSVAIKFDLVDNAGEGSNSVGVFTGGAAPTTPAVSLDGTGIDLRSGHPLRADIDYDGIDLTLTLTDTTAPDHTWTHTFAVDIPAALQTSTAYVGFTAGTGELFTRQSISSWTYTVATPADGVNKPPQITTPTRVILEEPTAVVLGGGAIDDGGTDNLTYNWTVVSTPAGASPQVTLIDSPDYPAAARVSLDRIGAYTFLLIARDAQGLITTSSVSYVLAPKITSLDVGPQAAILQAGETARFIAVPLDQFGGPMTLPGPVAWQVLSGPGTIDSTGVYTAPTDQTGTAVVRAVVPVSQLIAGEATIRVVPATSPAGRGVDFSDGFDGANLFENGSSQVTDNRLRLVDGPYQAGSAYAPSPMDVRGFTTSFRFKVGDGPSWNYGDGLTFVFQNAGPTAIGKEGGGLGYAGIGQSVAVKFDLVDNAGEGTDSVGVFTNGATPTVPADTFVTRLPFHLGVQFNSGDRFQATLTYSGGTLLLQLLDLDTYARTFTKAYAVDIPAVVGGSTAYVGFTAGTGELFAPIDVLDWTYTPTVDANGDAAPIIVAGPEAADNLIRGRSTQFSALGADDGGEANLTYTWIVTGAPQGAAPVRFSANGTNAARTTTATFDQAGAYLFQVVVTDAAGHAVQSGERFVVVEPTASAFVIHPAAPTVANGTTVDIAVESLDQFGDPMPFGSGSWHLTTDGPGFVNITSNQYIAPVTGIGPATIRASNGTVTGTATVMVVDRPSETSVDFTLGNETSPGLILNGAAAREAGGLLLTHSSNTTGSAFTATPLDVRRFATRFVILTTYAPGSTPDGVAFVIQGAGPTALGAAAPGFGYEGLDHSVALVFDRQANSFGLAVNGGPPVLMSSLEVLYSGIDLQGGTTLADLAYDGTTLTVTLMPSDFLGSSLGVGHSWQFPVDIPALVGGPTAYVGFTGASGPQPDQFGVQSLRDWSYRAGLPGAPNQAPVIVRPARLLTPVSYRPEALPLYAQFVVRAEDDSPFNLQYRWQLVSAPPGVAVDFDPLGVHGVRFDQPGTYVFRVTVTDAFGLTATSDATYVVAS